MIEMNAGATLCWGALAGAAVLMIAALVWWGRDAEKEAAWMGKAMLSAKDNLNKSAGREER